MSVQQDVREVMRIAGQPVRDGVITIPVGDSWSMKKLEGFGNTLVEMSQNLASEKDEVSFRARLMLEELGELLVAMANGDAVEVADGVGDLCYVAVGTDVQFGIPFDECWNEIQRSNLSKFPRCEDCFTRAVNDGHGFAVLGFADCTKCNGVGRIVTRDAQGKFLKPPGWTPPDISRILFGT